MLLSSPELARLAALAAARRHGAPGAAGGGRPGPRLGEGGEFAGHRGYTAGDDPRLIDWAAYARTGGLHIREFREQVEGSLTVLLDLSSSMAAWEKDRTARRVAAAAIAVALLSGDRARVVPFAGGRDFEPGGWSEPAEIGEMDRRVEGYPSGGGPAAVAAVRTLLRARRGRILLVSDLLDAESPGAPLVALRERGHAVVVAHVLAREEASRMGHAAGEQAAQMALARVYRKQGPSSSVTISGFQ
ncbi:MAG: DUF58 domain-containing protein [Candidatus Brocadiae bacterium]|nr:DUF58 domain-containing protein [Candidatus Brocadiia bacterium]